MYYILVSSTGHIKVVEIDSKGNCLIESMWGDYLDNKTLDDLVYRPLYPIIDDWIRISQPKHVIKTEDFHNLKEQFPELFI